ncbi:serine hydrolase domain-containing protein [Streptomyces sp. MST-110588]|uniref:serine hydrolase domain-containing protein n=1 Tax=Streptomyces sp. MST-110588 TaxID=2833628 RepID=UPI001F5CD3EC|nr:serine hydrolase domain-containing protein [Streptomyces sp. MST-110588]UNO41227.1 beta-lactamase family protein [Streptomyces sp. MST-110588]
MRRSSSRSRSRYRPQSLALALAPALAALTAATVALGAVAPAAQAAGSGKAREGLNRTALREAIAIRPGGGVADVVARVSKDGESWRGTSGDAVTGKRVKDDAHFRIGSIAKTFEAVVLLQLSAEGKVDLDETVQHYLPGLLPDSYDPVTVRQLLNHTSGLPQDFEGAPAPAPGETVDKRHDYYTFDQVIEQTLRPEGRPAPTPHFKPGTKQEYNSFAYRVAGKLIEEITGHSLKREFTTRILKPLKMRHTSAPGRDVRLPRPYLPGYAPDGRGELVDVNEQGGNPSSMISTTADLDRFVTGLFNGRLLRPAQAAELRTLPRDADGKLLPYTNNANCNMGPDKGSACYSVGLMSFPLPNGKVLWGKTGSDPGYTSGVFATPDLKWRGIYAGGTAAADNSAASATGIRIALAAFAGPAPAKKP